MKKLLYIGLPLIAGLLMFAMAMTVKAAVTSWDFSGGILQPLQSQWSALIKGSYFQATSTTATSTFPVASTTKFCIGSDCRMAWPTSSGTSLGTSSPWTAGFLTYVVDDATVRGVATTSLTASSPLSFSQPVSVIGSSASILSLDTSGDWTGTLDGIEGANFLRSDVADTAADTITFTGTGVADLPFNFANDTDTGLYSDTVNLRFVLGGSARTKLTPGQWQHATDGSAGSPVYSFENNTNTGMYTDGTNLFLSAEGTGIVRIDNDLVQVSGVGNSDGKVEVGFSDSDTGFWNDAGDLLYMTIGGVRFASFIEDTQDVFNINPTSADIDTVIEATGVADALVVNGADGTLDFGAYDCSANTNNGKLTVDASGNVICADDVSGGGGSTGLATSSPWTGSGLAYRTSDAAVSSVATTTLSGTANQVAVSNSPVLIGASPAVLSLPSHVAFPGSYVASSGSTTNATSSDIAVLNHIRTSTGIPAISPSSFTAYDSSGNGTLEWSALRLLDGSANVSLDWGARLLSDSTTNPALDYSSSNNFVFGGYNCSGNANDGKLTVDASGNLVCADDISGGGGTSAFEIATTSTIAVPQLAYFTNASGRTTLGGVATTTLTISGPFNTSATPIILGASPITSTYWGLSTTTTLSSSNLLVSNGTNGVYGVATSSATLGLGLTGSLTTLGTSQSLSIATSSLFTGTTGQVAYFSGTNQPVGTSSLFIATSGYVGIGTTSPFAKSSIHANNGETNTTLFAIGSSTASATTTLFQVSNRGVASTTALRISGLADGCLTITGELVGSTACGGGGGGTWPFTPTTNYGVVVQSTSTPIWGTTGLMASSTSRFEYASTTAITILDNYIDQHVLGFLDIQRTGADFTLARIRAPRGDSNEATLSLVVDLSTTDAGVDEEFVDFYNERYGDSLQWGIRQAYSGTGIPKPGVFGFWNTAGGKDVGNQFMLMPNGTSAFAQATSTIDTAGRLYIASSTASALLIVDSTPGTELLRITSDGRLGIGTSSPSDQITASVGNNAGIRVSSTNSGFYDVGQGNGDRWRIQNNFTGTGLLEFLYNAGAGQAPATTLLTLTGTGSGIAGRVGIGTTTPGKLFDVFSTATTTIRADSNSTTHGSCLVLKDRDGVGYTYITVEDGELYADTVSCE